MSPHREPRPEITVALARHGYGWSDAVRGRLGVGSASPFPALPVRVLGRRALLLGGPAGVQAFTDTSRTRRAGATPGPVAGVVFGSGGVHGLDDDAHRTRKELFAQVLDLASVDDLVLQVDAEWRRLLAGVRTGDEMDVRRTSGRVVGRGVLRWAGIPVDDDAADEAADRWGDLLDGFGVPGPAYLRSAQARRVSDRWAMGVVDAVRDGTFRPVPGTPVDVVAHWSEDGEPLPTRVAAVELQNLLRPAVAVSRLVAFGVRSLLSHPHWLHALRDEPDDPHRVRDRGASAPLVVPVAREVRRLAPFVPLLAARARADEELLGVEVRAGERLVLDVVGTLRDPARWSEPLRFSPRRFLDDPHRHDDALVPQGGGDVLRGHRCPGEDPVLGVLAVSLRALAEVVVEPTGDLPPVDERRVPATVHGLERLPLRTAPGDRARR